MALDVFSRYRPEQTFADRRIFLLTHPFVITVKNAVSFWDVADRDIELPDVPQTINEARYTCFVDV